MRQKRSRQHDTKCRLKSSQIKSVYCIPPSKGNSTNYYIILGPRDKAAPSHKSTNRSIPSEASEVSKRSSIFNFYFFLIHRRALCSQTIRGNVRQTRRIFPEHVERSFLDTEDSFVAVGRITRNIFAKQKFAQLRTNYIRRILLNMFANKCSAN